MHSLLSFLSFHFILFSIAFLMVTVAELSNDTAIVRKSLAVQVAL
jgi:hypothetical protein